MCVTAAALVVVSHLPQAAIRRFLSLDQARSKFPVKLSGNFDLSVHEPQQACESCATVMPKSDQETLMLACQLGFPLSATIKKLGKIK